MACYHGDEVELATALTNQIGFYGQLWKSSQKDRFVLPERVELVLSSATRGHWFTPADETQPHSTVDRSFGSVNYSLIATIA